MRALSVLGVFAALFSCGPSEYSPEPPAKQTKPPASEEASPFAREREAMVSGQIAERGVADARVLDAMRRVPRHLFVPPEARSLAYTDGPLPIGLGQTISQPYIVAFMTEAVAVKPGDKTLEIGTGSGYQAAVLAELASHVHTVEILCELADRAREELARQNYKNITVRCGDGYKGWPEEAPFDVIVVTAAPPEIPAALVEQLASGGRMVVPVGRAYQNLVLLTKDAEGMVSRREILPVRFVPMVPGKEGEAP